MDELTPRTREETADLYRRHIGMVYQICLMMMKNVPDAEDAAQTVFRKAMEHRKPFHDPEHEKAWLIVTARNECKNQLRHWWRTQRADEAVLNTIAWEQPSDGALWEHILSLSEHERMAVYLHYYQGYATDEVAALMKRKPSTVRTWLARARKKLKTMLEVDMHE